VTELSPSFWWKACNSYLPSQPPSTARICPIVANLDNFGVFTFQTSAPTTTGNALADFVTGQVNTMEQDTPYHGLLSDWHTALFVQDAYRISPRLTANLGLRWDIDVPPVESSNLTGTFVPGVHPRWFPVRRWAFFIQETRAYLVASSTFAGTISRRVPASYWILLVTAKQPSAPPWAFSTAA
jgi:hypothetical protein